ncbi:MAG: hypothetical protein AB7F88_09875 [Pyrinomonadaceae bacterium]
MNGMAQAQANHFRIISFSIDGKETENFDVFFLLDGKSIEAAKSGNCVSVPPALQKADWNSSGIRFVSSNLAISFDNLAFRGYAETDEIKTDYKVQIYTDPAKIFEYLKGMSDKSKRDLGIRQPSDVCGLFVLSRLPEVRENAMIIADPVTLTKITRCGGSN